MNDALKNAIFFLVSVALSIAASIFSFLNPSSTLPASGHVITSISILLGLSLAISSLASKSFDLEVNTGSTEAVNEETKSHLIWEDQRTRRRQDYLMRLYVATIILGIVFVVSCEFNPGSLLTQLLSASFTFSGSVSLLNSFFLPALLKRMHERNTYLQSK